MNCFVNGFACYNIERMSEKNSERREQPEVFFVRDADAKDLESVARIQYDSWVDTYSSEATGVNEDDIQRHLGSLVDSTMEWRRLFESAKKETDKIFVIDEHGQVVGFCHAKKFLKENRIVALHIDPKRHGIGAGTRIFQRVLKWFGDEKDVSLGVVATNQRAIAFYQKFGFEKDDEGSNLVVNGKEVPTIRMVCKAG